MHLKRSSQHGFLLIHTIVIGSIAAVLITGLLTWATTGIKAAGRLAAREQAFQIGEAGAEYYRWHLAHAATDYQDGTATTGPYVHEFYDKNNDRIGEFSLDITAPDVGSTIVTVASTGSSDRDAGITRTVTTRLAKPSIAKYAVVADDVMRFGSGTEVYGQIHGNEGIRFDGLTHNIVTSAAGKYDDPDHSGGDEWGVHTHVTPVDSLPPDPIPPDPTLPSRPDVFEVGREVQVPVVDFGAITADLAQMQTDAQSADGFWAGPSGGYGYHIVLNTDDTFDLYRVTSTVTPPNGCTDPGQTNWGTWSIQNELHLDNHPFPVNGIMFFEDHIYVDGQVDTARLTLIGATLPDNELTRKSATINNDLLYTNYDGSDVVGIIVQDNVNIGMVSADVIRIDAALIAQNGRVGRYYYRKPSGGNDRCSPYHERDTATLWGMIGTAQRYGFAYTDDTGYDIRNLNYDGNLLYGPPPSFPLTSDQYETISWHAD